MIPSEEYFPSYYKNNSVLLPHRRDDTGIAPALLSISNCTGVHCTQVIPNATRRLCISLYENCFSSVFDIWARQRRSLPSITRDTIGTPYRRTVPTCKEYRIQNDSHRAVCKMQIFKQEFDIEWLIKAIQLKDGLQIQSVKRKS